MKYSCQIPDCNNKVVIRSKIKNRGSEYYGKMACDKCAKEHNIQKEKKTYRIKNRTEKTTEKRREERSDYPEFFKRHIEYIKENNTCCAECGDKLRGESSNIAHVVSKSLNPEVATHQENFLFLCGLFSKNNCHAFFDSNFSNREKMKVFSLAVEKYKLFKDQVKNITKEVLLYEKNLK